MLAGFEAETGIRVSLELYASNEEMMAGLTARPGAWDVVVPSDYAVEILIREGRLLPLDLARVPGYSHIDPAFLNPYFDPGGVGRAGWGRGGSAARSNEKYTLPFMWGTIGIGCARGKVDPPPATWADLWRADLAGRIAVVDDAREMLGIALLTLGHDKNATGPEQIADAKDRLLALAPGIVAIDSAGTEDCLVDGRAAVAVLWSGDAASGARRSGDLEYVLPADGAGIWFDNLAIPSDTPHVDAAFAFLEYMMRPEVSAAATRPFGFSNPNRDAIAHLAESDPAFYAAYSASIATNPPPAALAGARLVKDVGPEAAA